MAGPKIRLPRSLGLPGLLNRGVGRLPPREHLKPPTLATPSLNTTARDGFSQPQPDNPWRIFANTTPAPGLLMTMPSAQRPSDGPHTFTTGIPGMPDVPLQGPTTDIQARMQLSEAQHALYNTWIQNHYVGALVERSYAAILDVASAYRTWASQAMTRTRQALDLFEVGTLSVEGMLQIGEQLTAEETIYSAIFRAMGHVEDIGSRDDRKVLSSRLRSAIAQLSSTVLGLFLMVRLDTSHSTPPHFKEYRDFLAEITDKAEADGYPPGISAPYHSHEIARDLLAWLNVGGTREARDGLWTWTGDRRESVTVMNQSNALNGRAWPPDPVRDPMLAAQLKFLGWEMRIGDENRVVLETAPAQPRPPTGMPAGLAADAIAHLGIVGGEAGKFPTLQHYIQLPMWADAVSARDFRYVIEDHFHPDHFKSPFILFRRGAILDRLTVRETEIDRDFARKTGGPLPVSASTMSLLAADAFLARTQARSEAFVELLELRVEAQLRTRFGYRARFTDMDLEAERNHVLADVLSEGIGAHLPIAAGPIAVSTRDGVIVLRPERSDDYAVIDRMLQDGKISGEALTGGFYCGRNALGLPFIVINPAMGTHAWGVLRHELQHLRKHASNRTEPYWQMPTPDTVADYPDALRQHFFVLAKDEVLAYLEEARPPEETVATLTRPDGLYDFIAKKRDKLQLGDDDVVTLKQAHFSYIARQVWALHVAVTDMVNYGYHPEAARHELLDRLSDIPFAQWETQLPLAAESAMAVPPRRQAPPPGANDGQRAELRRFLETQVLPRRKGSLKRLNTIAQRQNQKMEAIEDETRGVVGTQRLQVLRQELQTGNSEMEQLSEVLQRITDEYRGQRQVVQRRRAASREEVRANGAQFRQLTNTLAHLDMLQDKLAVYLKNSGIIELQMRIDRALLIRTAHSQKLILDSAHQAIDGLPLIRVSDGADIRPEDHLKASASASASGKPDGPPTDAAGFKATVATPKGKPAGPTSLPGAIPPPESEASAPNDPDAAWRGHPGIVSAISVHYSGVTDNDRVRPDFDLTDPKTSYAIAEGLAKYAQYICIGMKKDQISLFPIDPFYPAASFLRIMDGLHDHADIPRPARRRDRIRSEETWEAHLREAFADDNNLIRDALAYCHFHVRELAQELQIPETRLGARLARYRNALELSTPEVSPEQVDLEESRRRDAPPPPPSRPTPAAPEVLHQTMISNREILRTIQDQPRGLGTTTMKLLGRAHHTPGGPNHVPFQVVVDAATGAILPNHYSQLSDLRRQGRDADLVIFRIFAVQRSTELGLLRQQLERRGEWGQEKIPGWLMTRISGATDSDLKFAYTSAVAEAGGGEPALRALFIDRIKYPEIPAGSRLPPDVRKALRTLEGARFNEKEPTPPKPEGGGGGGGKAGGTDTDRALLQALRNLPSELRAEALSSGLTTPRVYETLAVEGVLSRGKFQEALRLMLANVNRDHSGAMDLLKRMGYRETEIPALAKAIMDGPIDTLPVIVGSLITRPTAESLRDIAAAMHPDGDFLVFTYRALLRLPRIARATGIDLSDIQIAELAHHYADELIEVATTNSLGAVSPKMALQALLHRQDFLKTIGIDLHTPPAPGDPIRTVPLGDTPYTLALEMGKYEAACGLQLVLYDMRGEKPAPLAIVGFQESRHGIEILRYQGGFLGEAESSNAGRRFRAVSGGVAPLPWLALMTGQVLLTHSQNHGKPLRFLAGERVLFGYPHVGDVPPPQIRSLQDARGPWQTPLLDKWVVEHHRMVAQRNDLLAITTADTRTPFQSQLLEQLDRALMATAPLIQMYADERAVQRTYDQTAAQLGFERIGTDAPFHDYHKGVVAFGADIRAQSDGLKLDRLLEAATAAMRGDAVFAKWMGRTAPMSFELPALPPPLEDGVGRGTASHYSGAPWVAAMLNDALGRIARVVGDAFNRLPISATANFDDREAARAARKPEIARWVRTRMFNRDTVRFFEESVVDFAQRYQAALSTLKDPQDIHELHDRWRRESALFEDIVTAMLAKAQTPQERDLAARARECLYSGPFSMVQALLEARTDLPMVLNNAIHQVLQPGYPAKTAGSSIARYMDHPLVWAKALRTVFSFPHANPAKPIQAMIDYIQMVETGKLPPDELRQGAHDLSQALVNGYAGDQSPIARYTLLFFANRLLGVSERKATLSRHDQAALWEDEIVAAFVPRLPPTPDESGREELDFNDPRAAEDTIPDDPFPLPDLPAPLAGPPPLEGPPETHYSGAPWAADAGAQLLDGARRLLGRLRHGAEPRDLWGEMNGNADALYAHIGAAIKRGEKITNPDTGAPFDAPSLIGYVSRRRYTGTNPWPELVVSKAPPSDGKVQTYSGAPWVGEMMEKAWANALAALNVGSNQYRNFGQEMLRQASRILTIANQANLKLSPDELQYMAHVRAADRIDVVRENSMDAVDDTMALTAMRNRFHRLSHLYDGPQKMPDQHEHDVASIKLGNGIRLTLQYGLFEAGCGMQATLSAPGRFGTLILGTLGFQESDTGIEVVRYQGTKHHPEDANDTLADFREFSGGVDPMPWLATVIGTTLLEQARAQGKTLRWIAGERVAMGYPHLMGDGPSHIHSVQDARAPWDAHPQHAAILAEYDALAASSPSDYTTLAAHYRRFQKLEPYAQIFRAGERRTARLYDATAQNLGFRRKGADNPWHRYTKDPAEFASAIRNGQGVTRKRFDQSVAATLGAMRSDPMFGKWMAYRGANPSLPGLPPPLADAPAPKQVHYSGAPFVKDTLKRLLARAARRTPPTHLAAHMEPYIKVRKGKPAPNLEEGMQELASMEDSGHSAHASDSAQLGQSIVAYRRYNNAVSSDSGLSPEEMNERDLKWQKEFESQVLKLLPGGVPFGGEPIRGVPSWSGWFWGRGRFENEDGGPQGRFYLSVKPGDTTVDGATFSNAAMLYAMLTRVSVKAQDNGHPFGFKIINSLSGLKRGDSAVVYFSASDQEYLYHHVLLPLSRQGLLKENTPLFTANLLDPDGKPLTGIAFGQSPTNRYHSFGSRRAAIIDDITHSTNGDRARGKKFSFNDLVYQVAEAFREAGVDPDFPAFDVGGRDVFSFIASHASMSAPETAAAQIRWRENVRAETARNKDIMEGNRGNVLAADRYNTHIIMDRGAILSHYELGASVDRRTGAILSLGFIPKELSSDPNVARVMIAMERGEDHHYRVKTIQPTKDGKASPDLIMALNEEWVGSSVTPPVATEGASDETPELSGGPLLMIGLNPKVQLAMTALWKGASRFFFINPDAPYPQVANVVGKNIVDGLVASYGGLARQRLDAVEPLMGMVIEKVGKARLKKILHEAFQYTHNYHTPFVVLENLAFGISNDAFLQMMGMENVLALSHPKSRTSVETAVKWFDDYRASGLSMDLDPHRITTWLAAGIESHRIDAPHFARMRARHQAEINALSPELRTDMVVCHLMTDREFTVLHEKGLIKKFGLQRIMQILVSAKTRDAQALQGHLAAIGFSPEIAPALAMHLVKHTGAGFDFIYYNEVLLSRDVADVELLFPYFKSAFGDQFEQWRAFGDLAKIREHAARTGVALSPKDAARMAAHNELATMDIVIKNTLGAVDERSAMEASLVRHRLSGELGFHHHMSPFAPLGNPPSYHLALQLGEFEGYNGFQIVLQDKTMRLIGTVGFQESDTHIDVVRYQGGKIRPDMLKAFLKFSGGLDTMQWLGLVAATFLSNRALVTGKTLRWISGDRVHMGYPHRRGQAPGFESIESARNFWKAPHPEIDAEGVHYDALAQERSALRQQRHLMMRKEHIAPDAKRKAQIEAINARIVELNQKIEPIEGLVTMYRRGPHTQRLYDTAAAALGFERTDDGLWHTFTGRGQGDALRAKADPNNLDASLKLVDDAMRADPVFSKWMGSPVTPPSATKSRPSGSGAASLAARGQPTAQTPRPPLGIVGGAGEYPELKYPLPEGRAIDSFSPRDTRKIFSHFFGGRTEPGAVTTALRRSRSPAEAFVQLLDQRATTQLKKKLGRNVVLTDMDLEAERNRIMAEVLSTALGGANIPVAKGRVTVTSEGGVLIVRPSTEADYGYIDNAVADSGVPSEPVTGGFFCNTNALGIPIVFINPSMGTQAWSVYRHEMQHARQYPVNRVHPNRELIGVSLVNDDGTLNQFAADFFTESSAVHHFLIGAHDEALAYFAQGAMAAGTISRLTHSKSYDFIDHAHDDLMASYRKAIGDTHINALFGDDTKFTEWAEAQIKTIRTHYNQVITKDVHALHAAHATLVKKGHHPEAAKALLIKQLSTIQDAEWPSAIDRLLKTLDGKPPQRNIPQGKGLDRKRLNLRRRIEQEFWSSDAPSDAFRPVIAAEIHKITAAIAQASATTDVATLQNLRRHWAVGATPLEHMSEVLHHMSDECFALQEVQSRPDANLDKTLSTLFVLRRMIYYAMFDSGLDKLRDILDRKLLLHAAHTQHTLQTHARRFASAPIHGSDPSLPGPVSLPRLRPADIAAMTPKDRFRQVVRLRTAIASATSAALLQRAVHLYAALVRNGDLGDYRLRREFDSMAGIVLHHPDRMPDLKLAFAAIRGATGDALWHSFLERASPTLPGIADRDPKFPGMFTPIAIR